MLILIHSFTVSGFLWGVLGLLLGLLVLFITLSPGLSFLAMGILWIIVGRKRKNADGTIVKAPRAFFMPLFIFGILSLILAPVMFWGVRTIMNKPSDPRAAPLEQDLIQLDKSDFGGIESLSKSLQDYLGAGFGREAGGQSYAVFTKVNQDKILVLVKFPHGAEIKQQTLPVMIRAITDYLKNKPEYRNKKYYIRLQNRWLVEVKTPEPARPDLWIHERELYAFYGSKPVIETPKPANDDGILKIIRYIGVGILGVVILITLFGLAESEKERGNAVRNLQLAQHEFSDQNYFPALIYLNKAFYIPLNERYQKEDAIVAYRVMELLEEILARLGIDEALGTDDLKTALYNAGIFGGKVPDSLTKPVKVFLEQMEESVNQNKSNR